MQIISNQEDSIIIPTNIATDYRLTLEALGLLVACMAANETKTLSGYAEATQESLKSAWKLLVQQGYLVKAGSATWEVSIKNTNSRANSRATSKANNSSTGKANSGAIKQDIELQALSNAIPVEPALGLVISRISKEKSFKSYVLKQLKSYKREIVEKALRETERRKPDNPIAYLAGTLKRLESQRRSEVPVLEDW